jgi:hypothetical protein
LRGSVTTEAISSGIENIKIATLPKVARNDEKQLRHSLKRGNPEMWTPRLCGDKAWMPAWRGHNGKLPDRSIKLAGHFGFSLRLCVRENFKKYLTELGV